MPMKNTKKSETREFVRENRYTKSIAISPDNLKWIKETKGKKSAAGKLNEIIEFYKEFNKYKLELETKYSNLNGD